MKKIINTTVILPILNCTTESDEKYLKNALLSVANNKVLPEKVIVVVPETNYETINSIIESFNIPDININVLSNKGSTDLATQLNLGVSNATTEYFSFLEYDDEYSGIWFDNVDKYMQENKDVDIFLPIISDVNQEQKFLGYTNEIAWAYEFTDKHGFIDGDTLKDYHNFNPNGMVMKKEMFVRMGGYKKNIKLTFNLEFLLRAIDRGASILVIPKIGYKHVNMREDSLFWNYKNGSTKLSQEESRFWLDQAKKEYYYNDDREIIYKPIKE